MTYNTELFVNSLEKLNLNMTNQQMGQFIKFYEILIEKNKVMNLTGITEFEEVVIKHFVDSLSIVKIIDLNNVKSIIDVGTGAGFPGVPIKIMFPHMEVLLLDSLNKRIKFLEEACEYIGLNNISGVHGRAEEIGRNTLYRENYDLCVSRAVANLAILSEYCMPFVKEGGSFICYKAGNSEAEIEKSKNAIKILSGKIEKMETFELPNSDISRTLLEIKKIKSISKKYPRKAGTPAKMPLV